MTKDKNVIKEKSEPILNKMIYIWGEGGLIYPLLLKVLHQYCITICDPVQDVKMENRLL